MSTRVLLALAVCLAACAGGNRPAPGVWDFERMRRQPRTDAFAGSTTFADGMAMRTPPEGTIPRGGAEAALGAGRDGNGGYWAEGPVPATETMIAKGRDRYGIYCRLCHGDGGFGGTAIAANLVPTRAFTLRTHALRSAPAGYLYEVVARGKGRMPSLAWQLSPGERWAVVAYVRRMLASPPADSAAIADSLRAEEQTAIDVQWGEFLRRRADTASRRAP